MTTCIHTTIQFLLLATCFVVLQPTSASVIFNPDCTECDSLFLSNGTAVAVKHLSWDKNELRFSYCNDTLNTVRTAPWQQIRQVKKADGAVTTSPYQFPSGQVVTTKQIELERRVEALNIFAVISIPAILFFGFGFLMAIITLINGARLYKAIEGQPNEAYLRKRIRRARRIAKFNLLLFVLLGIAIFGYIIYFFSLFNKM